MLADGSLPYTRKRAAPALRVALLGIPRLTWNGSPLSLVRRQARAIIFRLAYAAAPVGREALADLLWPNKEPAAARRNHVRLLSSLRADLRNRDLLLSDRTAVWLDPNLLSTDVHDLVRLSSSTAVGDWESAAALYRGSFLSGFLLSSNPAFDEWQQSAGYDLERRYLETVGRLVNKFQARGDVAHAIDYANRYLAVDELAETIHCSLITLYAISGKRTDALQQYSRCVEILHHELGVEPLPKTRAAFEVARDGVPCPHPVRKQNPTGQRCPVWICRSLDATRPGANWRRRTGSGDRAARS